MEKAYKLTLSVNATTAKRAKKYAHTRKTSVTKLVEHYLAQLVKEDTGNNEDFIKKLHPSVRAIAGIMTAHEMERAKSVRKSRLKKKHE